MKSYSDDPFMATSDDAYIIDLVTIYTAAW